MHKNPGLRKEEEIVKALDGKKIKEINNNLRYILREIFGLLDEEQVVHSNLVGGFQKPDFYIEYNLQRKFVSLKSGGAKIVHQELLKGFIHFLRDQGVSTKSLKTFLYYHFGDGTMDGTGEKRYSYHDLQIKMAKRIKEFNNEVNSNKELIKAVVDRCVFTGSQNGNIPADYLYFGNSEFGCICSRTQVMKHLNRKDWFYMDNFHIGPLQFRPHARYHGKRILNEESRWKVDVWWANLNADVEYISERYNG